MTLRLIIVLHQKHSCFSSHSETEVIFETVMHPHGWDLDLQEYCSQTYIEIFDSFFLLLHFDIPNFLLR